MNYYIVYRLSLFFVTIFLFSSCKDNNSLTLTKTELRNFDEIDTIEYYPLRHSMILGVTISQPFGQYDYFHVFAKKAYNKEIFFRIERDKKVGTRVSKDYISFVKGYGETNWGWFYFINGKIQDSLPLIVQIKDSLKNIYPKETHINSTAGYLTIYKNGKIIEIINYGEFILDSKNKNLDSLNYSLYKFENGKLKIMSNNGDDLFNQKEGLFFIPKPGYGVLSKYNKQEILNVMDSVSQLSRVPQKLIFRSTKE